MLQTVADLQICRPYTDLWKPITYFLVGEQSGAEPGLKKVVVTATSASRDYFGW